MQLNSTEKSSQALVRQNEKPGWLMDRLLDFRVVIIDEHFYKGLRDKLYSSFESGASVILHDMGLGYGEILGTEMKEMTGRPSIALIGKFMNLGKEHGWGEFHIPLLSNALAGLSKEITIELKNCFFATSAGRTQSNECYIMAGIIEGVSTKLLSKPCKCREEKCWSKGDPLCEFKLKQL